MKNAIMLLCVLSLVAGTTPAYAQEIATKAVSVNIEKPVQVLDKGIVNETLKEPAGVDWSTGKGRKDGALKWAVADNYLKKVPGMFLRGFSNTAFGWVEILTHPVRWSKNAPLGLGTLYGFVMGPVMGTLRTSSGALDLATCWVPFWHGIPMSKPALGLHDVHYYDTIDDVDQYNHETRRYGFNKLSDEY